MFLPTFNDADFQNIYHKVKVVENGILIRIKNIKDEKDNYFSWNVPWIRSNTNHKGYFLILQSRDWTYILRLAYRLQNDAESAKWNQLFSVQPSIAKQRKVLLIAPFPAARHVATQHLWPCFFEISSSERMCRNVDKPISVTNIIFTKSILETTKNNVHPKQSWKQKMESLPPQQLKHTTTISQS